MYAITEETTYYINLRYAFYLTPRNAARISSRTVLFTSVPLDWRKEDRIRAEFNQIERVWVATDCKELEKLVYKRDNAAFKLEAAEIKLLSTAVTKSIKEDPHSPHNGVDVTSRYAGPHERPQIKSIPLIGRRKGRNKLIATGVAGPNSEGQTAAARAPSWPHEYSPSCSRTVQDATSGPSSISDNSPRPTR